jgi:hypothetical protein
VVPPARRVNRPEVLLYSISGDPRGRRDRVPGCGHHLLPGAGRVAARLARRPRDDLGEQQERPVSRLPPAARGRQPDRRGRVRDRGVVHAQVQARARHPRGNDGPGARAPVIAHILTVQLRACRWRSRQDTQPVTYANDMPYQCRWRSRQEAFRVDGAADSSARGKRTRARGPQRLKEVCGSRRLAREVRGRRPRGGERLKAKWSHLCEPPESVIESLPCVGRPRLISAMG